MFSQQLSSLKKEASTETLLMCRRTEGACATTSSPKTLADPESGVSRVPRIRMSVDLPLPLGPMIPVTPPAGTFRSSGSSATLRSRRRRHQAPFGPRFQVRKPLATPLRLTAVFSFIQTLPEKRKRTGGGPHDPCVGSLLLLAGGQRKVNVRSREGKLRPRFREAQRDS